MCFAIIYSTHCFVGLWRAESRAARKSQALARCLRNVAMPKNWKEDPWFAHTLVPLQKRKSSGIVGPFLRRLLCIPAALRSGPPALLVCAVELIVWRAMVPFASAVAVPVSVTGLPFLRAAVPVPVTVPRFAIPTAVPALGSRTMLASVP